MAARAMWKAELRIGDMSVPVRLYAAVADRKVRFRLLHAEDQSPVSQEMVDPQSGEPVESVRKGLEIEDGTFVVLTEADQKALEPEPSRAIHVEAFVDRAQVDARWLGRPYYLGPDGDDESYFALAAALENLSKVGIARWVMRKKHYQGAIGARGGYLMLEVLRHAEEVVTLEGIRPARGRAPDRRELALADKLVEALEDSFDPAAYHDTYESEVRKLIEAKAAGKKLTAKARKPARRRERSLADSLEASLRARKAHGRERKQM